MEFPDVSECMNIQEIGLFGCKSLVKLPPSIQHLPKLKYLNLHLNGFELNDLRSTVESIPTTFDSKVLEDLILHGCGGVKMFPQVASQRIRYLWLDHTDIREVPSYVELLKGLELLSMCGCKKLSIIPTNICKLKSLSKLDLRDCTNLESFPEIMEPMESLEALRLSGCKTLKRFPDCFHNLKSLEVLDLCDMAITELPSSIQHLICLKKLNISGCQNLESFPEIMEPMVSLMCLDLGGCTRLKRLPNDHSFHNLKSLEELRLDDTAITELPSSIQHLICLKELKISGCQNLTSLPSSIHNLRNLTTIYARDSGIVDLPESICQLFEMKRLWLSGCKRLRSLPANMKQLSQLLGLDLGGCSNLYSLPELPSSLQALVADGCVSLKTISSACFSSESRTTFLKFANCFNWDEEERRRVLDIVFSNLQYNLDRQGILNSKTFKMMLPWSTEIPQCFCGSQSVGSSLTLKLPMDDQCYRFAFFVVIKPNYANFINAEDDYSKLRLPIFNYLECYVDDDGRGLPVTSCGCELDHLSSDIEHLLLWQCPWDVALRKYFGREVSLQFRDEKGDVEVTKCGVLILPVEDTRNAESYS